MKLTIVVGSHRHPSQSARVGEFLARRWRASAGKSAETLDLGKTPLPLWEEDARAGRGDFAAVWPPIAAMLADSDGFILISPEYNGFAAPALKNLLLLCDRQELAHKPALIVGVSAGAGGAYPLAELRIASHKNTQLCLIPEQLVFRAVEQFDPDAVDAAATALGARAVHALASLGRYMNALRLVRADSQYTPAAYPYGL